MSLHKDPVFIRKLETYFNDRDVSAFIDNCSRSIPNANINKWTGRVCIGEASSRPQQILQPGSLKNYKSIILAFARYKVRELGRDESVSEDVLNNYQQKKLKNGRMKFQTIVTNIRVLNKYVAVPFFNKELKPPVALRGLRKNNKPKLTFGEIIDTLIQMWNHCLNRDHVYKVFLIYYTGLRSNEAYSLTFRDVIEAWGKNAVILKVRMAKNNKIRNIFLLKGSPTRFFRQRLIPYLGGKMTYLLLQNPDRDIESLIDEPIFDKSNYQASVKIFNKYLKYVLYKKEKCKRTEKLKSILRKRRNQTSSSNIDDDDDINDIAVAEPVQDQEGEDYDEDYDGDED